MNKLTTMHFVVLVNHKNMSNEGCNVPLSSDRVFGKIRQPFWKCRAFVANYQFNISKPLVEMTGDLEKHRQVDIIFLLPFATALARVRPSHFRTTFIDRSPEE